MNRRGFLGALLAVPFAPLFENFSFKGVPFSAPPNMIYFVNPKHWKVYLPKGWEK